MHYDKQLCNPCINCGDKPELVACMWGNDHWDMACKCGRMTDTDGKIKWAIKDWNKMNPVPSQGETK